ncbi:hypothetical protein E0L36_14660 [Streptomyces sp. AJS327]|uniref:protein phosphatase 2C domain-containing protein n=1 Tax=Streptomyces sp. AJS327 TaxID=2545265 RepID=UPI0015DF83AD|nr:protein phosphatase 2C domain-containing protein [Streptomyces sp. AJS327]MBA0052097.1 hypothetical protein [Streptomyces sp. AJS327]
MDEQGERRPPAERDEDWWNQLYDGDTTDTGRSRTGDTIDDRFASVTRTVGGVPAPAGPDPTDPPGAPDPRTGAAPAASGSPGDAAMGPEPGGPSSGAPSPGSPSSGAPDVRPVAEPPGAEGTMTFPRVTGEAAGSGPPDPGPGAPPPGVPDSGGPTLGVGLAGAAPAGDPPTPVFGLREETPAAPERPGGAGLPTTPGPPSAPGPPNAPGLPKSPNLPGGPSVPRGPEVPDTPGLPGTPAPPEVSWTGTDWTAPSVTPPSVDPRTGTTSLPRIGPGGAAPGETARPDAAGGAGAAATTPAALPPADPAALAELVPDTVLDGGTLGGLTVRVASLRGDAAREAGEPRRDAVLTARFGTGGSGLLLVALASGAPTPAAHRAARDVCYSIGESVGRSHARLAEDIRAGRRGSLKAGLTRLTDRCYGKLRAQAEALGLPAAEYTAGLRCLLLPADPRCQIRVFFGRGAGGLFRLRDGAWQDIEPSASQDADGLEPDPRPTMNLGVTSAPGGGAARPGEVADPGGTGAHPAPTPTVAGNGPPAALGAEADTPGEAPFLFRAPVARPGDTLLLSGAGLAEPLRAAPWFADRLAGSWAGGGVPGLAGFLAEVGETVEGHTADRSAVAVWEG